MMLSCLPMLADFKYRDMQKISALLSQRDETQCGKNRMSLDRSGIAIPRRGKANMRQHFVTTNIPPFGVSMLHSMCIHITVHVQIYVNTCSKCSINA